jgi:N-acetylneuraminate synthase
LEHARTGLNIILSSGMSNLKEVETALAYICFGYLNPKKEVKPQEVYKSYHSKEGKSILEEKVIILHCTSQYPAPLEDINLNALKTLKREFGTRIGYSDHSLGYLVSSSAISLGADVIEKHITLDKNLPGPDHGASLDPDEFKEFVKVIKDTEVFLGDGIKRITSSEEETKDVARKSIVANQFIKKGEIFTDENLTIKRPGIGMSPMQVWDLFGNESPKDFNKDEIIEI